MRTTKPEVSVVFGSFNRRPYLMATLASIRAHDFDGPMEIIAVDGGSTDGALEYLVSQKDVVTIVQHNRGEWRDKPIARRSWGYFMNLAFKAAQGKFICMISDDCLLVPGAIRNGIEAYREAAATGQLVGAVAFYFSNRPGPDDYYVNTVYGVLNVNHGLYRREALVAINYADEDAFAFYNADSDLCMRMHDAGYAIVDSPGSFVEHHSHANEGVRATNEHHMSEDDLRFMARWGHLDPDRKTWDEVLGRKKIVFHDPARTAKAWEPIDRWKPETHARRFRKASYAVRDRLQVRSRALNLYKRISGESRKPPS